MFMQQYVFDGFSQCRPASGTRSNAPRRPDLSDGELLDTYTETQHHLDSVCSIKPEEWVE